MNHTQRRELATARAERQIRAAAPFTKQAARLFHTEGLAVVEALPDQAAAIAAVLDAPWERFIEQIWFGYAVEESWARTIASIAAVKADPVQLPANIHRRLLEFVRLRRKSITDRTKADLFEIFGTAPPDSIPTFVRQMYERFSLTRAERIAIQEVLTAAETVQHAAAETASGNLDKIWTTVGDSHVRATHQAADGQRRPLDDPFIVGGYALNHPRDPAGPIEEVINCRCSEFYEQVERKPRRR